MTEAQKRDAYLEAQHILRLDKKWQQLMPGERKPDFRRVAREIIRRALGHKVRRNEAPLEMHDGLMHEHKPREAALIERTLKNGMYDPRILHSFQRGAETVPRRPEQQEIADNNLPDYEVFVHDHGATIDYPSHGHWRLPQQCARTARMPWCRCRYPQGRVSTATTKQCTDLKKVSCF